MFAALRLNECGFLIFLFLIILMEAHDMTLFIFLNKFLPLHSKPLQINSPYANVFSNPRNMPNIHFPV